MTKCLTVDMASVRNKAPCKLVHIEFHQHDQYKIHRCLWYNHCFGLGDWLCFRLSVIYSLILYIPPLYNKEWAGLFLFLQKIFCHFRNRQFLHQKLEAGQNVVRCHLQYPVFLSGKKTWIFFCNCFPFCKRNIT